MPSSAQGRYGRPRGPSRSEAEWHDIGRTAILSLLETEHAVTASEMEARLSDRVWDPTICPTVIDPHILTTARTQLRDAGDIVETTGVTRGGVGLVKTWSHPLVRGSATRIETAAARKRLLTARHDGWSKRGGAGRGLIGRAGEDALAGALASPRSQLTRTTGSTTEVLGVDLSKLGEIDNSAIYLDVDDPAAPTPITVVFEVKNTRAWYYADDVEVLWFLQKTAVIQAQRPGQLIMPVFLARQVQYTLWTQGDTDGFLPAKVTHQLVLPDHKLTPELFEEVRVGLGYQDMVLSNAATHQHLGIVDQAMRKYARARAELWAKNHTKYLAPVRPPR